MEQVKLRVPAAVATGSIFSGCVSLDFTLLLFNRFCRMLLDEIPLFDPSLLQDLDWSSSSVSFSPPISPSSPGDGLVLRPLCTADFNRGESGWALLSGWDVASLLPFCFPGFFKVLSELTQTGDVTAEQFIRKLPRFYNCS